MEKRQNKTLEIEIPNSPSDSPDWENISLEQKLSFYDQSPRNASRHLATSHIPWRETPLIFREDDVIPYIPPASSSGNSRQSTTSDYAPMLFPEKPKFVYHYRTELLGREGMDLLNKIIDDEKEGVKPLPEELNNLEQIALRNLKRHMRKKTMTQRKESLPNSPQVIAR